MAPHAEPLPMPLGSMSIHIEQPLLWGAAYPLSGGGCGNLLVHPSVNLCMAVAASNTPTGSG